MLRSDIAFHLKANSVEGRGLSTPIWEHVCCGSPEPRQPREFTFIIILNLKPLPFPAEIKYIRPIPSDRDGNPSSLVGWSSLIILYIGDTVQTTELTLACTGQCNKEFLLCTQLTDAETTDSETATHLCLNNLHICTLHNDTTRPPFYGYIQILYIS